MVSLQNPLAGDHAQGVTALQIARRNVLRGYQKCFGEVLGVSWEDCPADLNVIEQIVLGRNRDQHPEHIHSMQIRHSDKDLRKHPSPFFMSDDERRMYGDSEISGSFMMNPSVHVSREALFTAIEEVEKLAEWLEGPMSDVKYRR